MSWTEVRESFEALLALAPSARAARLAEIERERPELATELRELLEHDSAAESDGAFLDPTAARASAPAPERVGPWELVRELGRGGMGVVHLARRADGAFERRVALKLLHAGLDDERALERFRRERQVLANLDHPGIARLIEGGLAPDGRPYLVMDHVEGCPIDRWCDEERLDVRARVALFLSVCEAVQHAHEHLVVHRDLKPRNILVTPQGRPVLLDFGIAKVLDPEKTSATPELTLGLVRFLTPAYASPEQVAGRPITTASDVYSLGVVLYQLLTGELPYSVETTSAAEIERIVCQVDAGRPSASARGGAEAEVRARARGTTPAGLARALSGDLDRVVLKALRKESRQRYPSVEALAEDLRRQQAGLPVRARPDTLRYRASRFVARHRVPVAATALVFGALVAALLVSLAQYRRAQTAGVLEAEQRARAEQGLEEARRLAGDLAAERETAVARVAEVERLNAELETQRALAERRFAEVRDVATTLIFELYGALAPIEGSTPALELLARLGVAHLETLSRESDGNAGLERELVQAWLRMSAAQGGWNNVVSLGDFDGALASSARALEIAETLVRREGGYAPNLLAYVSAAVARATLLARSGRVAEALELLDSALEHGAPLESSDDTNAGQAYAHYGARVTRAQILAESSFAAAARDEMRAAEAALVRNIERFGRGIDRVELELLRSILARLDHGIDGGVEPMERGARALERLESLAAAAAGDQVAARSLRIARSEFAICLAADGDPQAALELHERNAREIADKAEVDPLDAQNRLDLVETARARVGLLTLMGRAKEALPVGEAGRSEARALAQRDSTDVRAQLLAADLAIEVGEAQLALGRALDAGESLADALGRLEQLLGRHPMLVSARRARLRALFVAGRAQVAQRPTGDPELERLTLERAIARLDEAAALGADLQRAGMAELEPPLGELEAELAAARVALARLGSD